MFKNFVKSYYEIASTLNLKEKKELYFLVFMMIGASVVEVLSLSLVIPLVYFLVENKNTIYEHSFFDYFPYIKDISYNNLILIILFLILTVFLVKLLFMIYLAKKKNFFIFNLRYKFSKNVFKSYLNRPYIFF